MPVTVTVPKKIPWSIFVAVMTGLGLLIFVGYKAVVTSFTHDESFTTLHFFPQRELDILFYRHPFTSVITNNHIFNTFMMKLSESIFGLSEWALRLPNILALGFYLVYGFLLVKRLKTSWMQVAGFLLLSANPYLVDFFGLARGYGISIAMMIGSIYYLLAYLQRQKGRQLLGFHLMGILSVMSNFALLNYYVAALGCWYVLPLLQPSPEGPFILRNWKFHAWNILACSILAALLYAPFKVILEHHTVSFGGKHGFFADTVQSIVRRSFYETPVSEGWITGIAGAVCLSVCLPGALILWYAIRRQAVFFKKYAPLFVCNSLCWLIALLTIIQHHWLGQDYLEDRFAIFLYPLFTLNLLFFTQWLQDQPKIKRIASTGLLLGTGLLVMHTVSNLNLEFYLNWKYDKDTKAVMAILRDMRPADPASPNWKIGIFHKLEPTMNLYRRWWKMDWIKEFDRDPPAASDDLVYMLESEMEQFGIAPGGEVLFRSPENDLILMKTVDGRRSTVDGGDSQ